ncbi:MAG: hypothetical protein ABJA34_14580 [Pseudonocardiales bacterium]
MSGAIVKRLCAAETVKAVSMYKAYVQCPVVQQGLDRHGRSAYVQVERLDAEN